VKFLVDALTADGVSVQLKHDDQETSWEAHGWISIVRDADGTELYRQEDYQHNRKFRQSRETAGTIVEAVLGALEEEPSKDAAGASVPQAALKRSDSAEAA